jgi:hypothetical protein
VRSSYSCPNILALLRSMSTPELLALIEQAPLEDLRVLHALAGIEDPPDEGCDDCPDCDCGRRRNGRQYRPEGEKSWYFPEEVQGAIFDRGRVVGLFPEREYGEARHEPPPTLVVEHVAKVAILAKRRGEGQEEDTADARANPLLGFSLRSPGDLRSEDVSDHTRREVHRLRNGAPVAGMIGVEVKAEAGWTVATELWQWRQFVKPKHYPARKGQRTA